MAAPVANGVRVEENVIEIHQPPAEQPDKDQKRPQFGTRFLTDPRQVFQHNAWYSFFNGIEARYTGSEIGITIATWAHSWVCWKKNNMYFLPLFERDNVEWSEEQEAAAQKKVQENSQPLPADKQGEIYLSYSIVLSLLPLSFGNAI